MLHTPQNRPFSMKSAANRQLPAANCQSRQCAYCGKGMEQGHSAAGFERLILWAKEAGVTFKVPNGRYLNPRCAAKVQALISSSHSQSTQPSE
jgi:hypothetical protein